MSERARERASLLRPKLFMRSRCDDANSVPIPCIYVVPDSFAGFFPPPPPRDPKPKEYCGVESNFGKALLFQSDSERKKACTTKICTDKSKKKNR